MNEKVTISLSNQVSYTSFKTNKQKKNQAQHENGIAHVSISTE